MQRDSYYDNLRFVLIAFVVVGHFALTYLHGAQSKPIVILKDWIWIFDMPAFLFVSGMFAKRLYTAESGLRVNVICFYLVMYLLFSVVIQLVMSTYEDPVFDPFHVYRIPWYFLALAILGASLPIAAKIRGGAKTVVPAAVAFAVVAGFNDGFGSFLSLGRIVNFAPFYLLGYFLSREQYKGLVRAIRGKPAFMVLDVLFLAGVYIALWFAPGEWAATLNALSMAYSPYAGCGNLVLPAIVAMRVLWFPLAFAMTVGVSALVPLQQTFYSELGQRTLQVYLLHPIIYLPLRGFDVIPKYIAPYVAFDGWAVLAAALLLTFALAYPKAPARWLKRLQNAIRIDAADAPDNAS